MPRHVSALPLPFVEGYNNIMFPIGDVVPPADGCANADQAHVLLRRMRALEGPLTSSKSSLSSKYLLTVLLSLPT